MTFTVLATAVDFGYGPAGKLSSILTELPDARIILYGADLGRSIFDFDYAAYPATTAVEDIVREHHPDIGLSVLEPAAVRCFQSASVATVYVDSLPFLWTERDDVPYDAALYCAQACTSIPRAAWPVLRRIERLTWTEGIVPGTPALAGTDGLVVVNVGGLATPGVPARSQKYCAIVLPAVLEALHATGRRDVLIAGNADAVPPLSELALPGMNVSIRCLPHQEFHKAVSSAALLLTAPGLTTILEAGAVDVPTVLLPPQNVSQCLNARSVSELTGDASVLRWPEHILSFQKLELVRTAGEPAAVQYVHNCIEQAAGNRSAREHLAVELTALLSAHQPNAQEYGHFIGTSGAQQVANMLRSTV